MKVKVLSDFYNQFHTAFIPEGTILESAPGEDYFKYIIQEEETSERGGAVFTKERYEFTISKSLIRLHPELFEVIVDDEPKKKLVKCDVAEGQNKLIKEYDGVVEELISMISDLQDKVADLQRRNERLKVGKHEYPKRSFRDEFDRFKHDPFYWF